MTTFTYYQFFKWFWWESAEFKKIEKEKEVRLENPVIQETIEIMKPQEEQKREI